MGRPERAADVDGAVISAVADVERLASSAASPPSAVSPAPSRLAATRTQQERRPSKAVDEIRVGPPPSSAAIGRVQLFGAALLFGLMAVSARLASAGGFSRLFASAPASLMAPVPGGGFSAGQLSLIRFATGIGACLVLFRLRPGTFRPVNYRLLMSRGLFGGVGALLYFIALERIPAGEATLLNSTHPIIAVLISLLVLEERPTIHLVVALVLTSLGVLFVLGGGNLDLQLGCGEIAGIASALFGAAAITSIRALRATDNAATIFLAFCTGGLLVCLPLAAGPWPHEPLFWVAAIVTGFFSVGAQLSMTAAYAHLTVAEAAAWTQLTPVSSYLWAFVLLREPVGAWSMFGVALALAGIAWGTIAGSRSPRTTQKGL